MPETQRVEGGRRRTEEIGAQNQLAKDRRKARIVNLEKR